MEDMRQHPLPPALLATLALLAVCAAPAPEPAFALKGAEKMLSIPFGAGEGQAAGDEEDVARITDGFPPAFAFDPKGRLFVLDAGNGRVLADDGKGGFTTLFRYATMENGLLPACRDLALFPDGKIAVADSTRGMIRIYDPAGRHLAMIEGFPALELGMSIDGHLLALHEGTRAVMKFNAAGELVTSQEGSEFRPVTHTGLSVFGVKMDSREAELLVAKFGGAVERVLTLKPKGKDEYLCNVRPVGFDAQGRLYLECLFAHDLDPEHEKHDYRMTLARVNTRTNEIEKEIECEPFRGQNSHVAPRQYVVHPAGEVWTYDVGEKEYSLWRYRFPEK